MSSHHGTSTNTRTLKISAILILIYFGFEITIALYTGSLALLADAAHELSTFIAIGVSLIAMQLAIRPPTPRRTFGLLRAETFAALFNGVLLLAMAGFIIIRGIDRLRNPMEVPSLPMFVMAIGGIGLEVATLIIMYKGQKSSLNIRGSFWHVVNAFLGSLAVIVAAVFISVWQIYVADAWAGILFAVILIWAAYGIIRDSFFILVDATPRDIDLVSVEKELLTIPGVIGVHHLHARVVSGDIKTFSGHVVVDDLSKAPEVLRQTKTILDEKYQFTLSTVQIEDTALSEADSHQLEYRSVKHEDL